MSDDESKFLSACKLGDVVGVRRLVQKGVDVNRASDMSGLWLAAEAGKQDVVEYLLANGAAPTFVRKKDGVSVLYIACQNGHEKVVKTLLEKGCKPVVNTAKHNGSTPLLICSQQGHTSIVSLLLQAGANPNVKNDQDVSPLMLSCYVGNPEMSLTLMRCGASPKLVGSGKTSLEWAKVRKNKLAMAVVHHYASFVEPMQLSRGGFCHKLFKFWRDRVGSSGSPESLLLGDADSEIFFGQSEKSIPASPVALQPEESVPEVGRRNTQLVAFRTYTNTVQSDDISDTEFDWQPWELTGGPGHRLRPVIVPDTLSQTVRADEELHSPSSPARRHGSGVPSWVEEELSKKKKVYDVAPYSPAVTHNLPTTHNYLRRLEAAYQAEFASPGVKAGGAKEQSPSKFAAGSARRTRTKEDGQRSKLKSAVASAFRSLYPAPKEREDAMREYCDQHTVLTKRLQCAAAARGEPKAAAPGLRKPALVNQYMNPRVPKGGNLFSSPRDERLDGSLGQGTWKHDIGKQQRREILAIRQATAVAVVANTENKILAGDIHAPHERANINRYSATAVVPPKPRDTHSYTGIFYEFHKKGGRDF
ncbi:hypothetical protein DIPPA_10338 [Diplonema papillatum]|nr:hypothetical protein DIPPA_10338 [Diplonema papillatum]|eukprot:gene22727-34802_t